MFLSHDDVWGPAPTIYPPAVCLSDRWDLQALISEEDVEFCRRWRWGYKYAAGVKCSTDKLYACRSVREGGRKPTVWLHREICWRANGPPPPGHTMADHRNGDSLDCQRPNLRWATPSMNAKNKLGLLARELRHGQD